MKEKEWHSALAITTDISGGAPFRNPHEFNAHGSRIELREELRRQGGETERNVLYVKTISAIKITAVCGEGRVR